MAYGCRTDSPFGHRFHPQSGWCLHNCGHRDDGRIVINGTEKYPGPEYTPEELHEQIIRGLAR